ncbi:MAG: hypothetical protein QXO71_05980, partial [Candidatus Jordarchaeaceae archaeon]
MISLGMLYSLVIYEILMAVLLLIIGIIFTVRWREKQSAALKYLALTYFMFIFGTLFAAYGHIIYTKYWFLLWLDYTWIPYLLTGYVIPIDIPRIITIFDRTTLSIVINFEGYLTTLIYQWSASLIFAAIGHLFIYLFTLSAFKEVNRKYVIPYAVFIGAVILILMVNLNITINWMLAFTVGLVTQGILIYYSIKAMRLTESKLYKRGFLLVSFTAVLFVLFFGCYLLDSLLGGWT